MHFVVFFGFLGVGGVGESQDVLLLLFFSWGIGDRGG